MSEPDNSQLTLPFWLLFVIELLSLCEKFNFQVLSAVRYVYVVCILYCLVFLCYLIPLVDDWLFRHCPPLFLNLSDKSSTSVWFFGYLLLNFKENLDGFQIFFFNFLENFVLLKSWKFNRKQNCIWEVFEKNETFKSKKKIEQEEEELKTIKSMTFIFPPFWRESLDKIFNKLE